jgi:signal peptidase I
MEPTLIPNDKLVTIRKAEYDRGDIVVLIDPTEEGSYLVKRIVAKGNDDIYVKRGAIMVNSKAIDEPYIKEAIDYDFGPYRIPEDHIFVLGDNRNNSEDGHHWGYGVPMDTIIGQVKYIYAPSARLRALPPMNQVFVLAGT